MRAARGTLHPLIHAVQHPAANCYTTIPNHPGDMLDGTPRAILKLAGIEPEAFLQKK